MYFVTRTIMVTIPHFENLVVDGLGISVQRVSLEDSSSVTYNKANSYYKHLHRTSVLNALSSEPVRDTQNYKCVIIIQSRSRIASVTEISYLHHHFHLTRISVARVALLRAPCPSWI